MSHPRRRIPRWGITGHMSWMLSESLSPRPLHSLSWVLSLKGAQGCSLVTSGSPGPQVSESPAHPCLPHLLPQFLALRARYVAEEPRAQRLGQGGDASRSSGRARAQLPQAREAPARPLADPEEVPELRLIRFSQPGGSFSSSAIFPPAAAPAPPPRL